MKCVRIIKCAKVRALFAENKVRFARAGYNYAARYKAEPQQTLNFVYFEDDFVIFDDIRRKKLLT